LSSSAQAFGLAGASPKYSATSAWTWGVTIQAIHLYMQFGCFAFEASIQVSAQPVIPSVGTTASTATPEPFSVFVWYGHVVPTTVAPLVKFSISSAYASQYLPMNGCWSFSSAIAASNWGCVSSYGSVIARSG
jgi:hypothetical protein